MIKASTLWIYGYPYFHKSIIRNRHNCPLGESAMFRVLLFNSSRREDFQVEMPPKAASLPDAEGGGWIEVVSRQIMGEAIDSR